MAETKLPALKNIPPKTDRELKIALDSLKEALEIRLGQRGDPLDRAVTLRELEDSGIVKVTNKEVGVTGGIEQPPGTGGSLTPPPAPSTLEASAAFTSITLSWTIASYGNHSYSEIWRSQDNALGGATRIATSNAFVYTDEVGYGKEYYYWIRYVSASDVAGPWNDTEGTSATTVADINAVMTELTEDLSDLPGYTTLTGLIDDAESAGVAASQVIRSTSEPTTRSDGTALKGNDFWVDTDDNNQVYARNAANDAWIKARDAQLVTDVSNLTTTVNTNTADISTNATAISTESAARASAISSLTATVNTNTSNISTNATAISNETTARTTAISNLTATVNKKNKSFIQTSAPADNAANDLREGDLWIDSDDDNKLYRWDDTNSQWDNVRDTANDGKATVFTQDDVPTSGVKAGDLWFDTNDSNKQYRAMADGSDQVTSGEWEEVRDVTSQAAIATNATAIADETSARTTAINNLTATVDTKTKSFIATTAPADNASNDLTEGDLWIDSDDDNKLYRWNDTSSSWVAVRDTSNDGKATIFTQDAVPTSGVKAGDLWFDTNDSNRQYRAMADGSDQVTSGEWEEVRDVSTQASVTTVSNAVANGDGANAGYGVSVNANGAIAGMYIMADSSGTLQDNSSDTNIIFEADQVTIRNPHGSNVTPFTVLTSTDADGNAAGVYIDTAFIKNGAIQSAQIESLSADLITTGGLDAARITSGTIATDRLDSSVIVATDLSTSGSTTIDGDNITTGTIDAARLDADVIVSSDLGSSGSTTIDGSRITTGQIDADRINVTDLVLPTTTNIVSGTTIGGFASNTLRLKRVGSIGTEPGIYQGYVRVFGGSGQVKTLSIVVGDGSYGAGSSYDLRNDFAYDEGTQNGNANSVPIATTGSAQFVSGASKFWSKIDRFNSTHAIAQLSFNFKKTSSSSTTTYLYILAQGDGGTRFLSNVEYSFVRLALNQPNAFTFTDVTSASTSTTYTSNTITLSGAGFTGGTATVTGGSYSLNGGSYTSAGSFTVSSGDTVALRVTSSSSQGTTVSSTLSVANVSDTYSVTTQITIPPGSPPGGGGPPGGELP